MGHMATMTKESFSQLIRGLVDASGERRVDIADRAGLGESSIRSIEGGVCPSVVTADRLLRALRVRLVIGDAAGETVEVRREVMRTPIEPDEADICDFNA